MTQQQWQETPEIAVVGRRTLAVLMAAQVVGGLGVGAGISVGSLVAEQVAGSESMAGISRMMSTVGTALFAVPLVMLARRAGRRGALSVGWALAALGAAALIGSLLAGSLTVLIVGMLIYGAGQAASLQSRFAVTDLAPARLRASWLSLVVWSTTIGTVLGPNLAAPGAHLGRLLHLPELSGAYLLGFAGLLGGAIITWLGLRPDPLLLAAERSGNALKPASPDGSRLAVLRRVGQVPGLWPVILVVALNQTVMVTMMTMAPIEMAHHQLTLTVIGLSLSLHTLGMFAFSPVVGWICDRWGQRFTLVLGCLVTASSLVCAVVAGHSMMLMMAGLFLLGLGWSFGMVSGSALLTELAPDELRTDLQGLSDLVMNLVAAVGAAAAGPILALLGYPVLGLVSMAVVVAMLVVVLGTGRTGLPGKLAT